MQPLRTLGEHNVQIRLTMDLITELKVIVYREGESVPKAGSTKIDDEVETVEEVIVEPIVESIAEPIVELTAEPTAEPTVELVVEPPNEE